MSLTRASLKNCYCVPTVILALCFVSVKRFELCVKLCNCLVGSCSCTCRSVSHETDSSNFWTKVVEVLPACEEAGRSFSALLGGLRYIVKLKMINGPNYLRKLWWSKEKKMVRTPCRTRCTASYSCFRLQDCPLRSCGKFLNLALISAAVKAHTSTGNRDFLSGSARGCLVSSVCLFQCFLRCVGKAGSFELYSLECGMIFLFFFPSIFEQKQILIHVSVLVKTERHLEANVDACVCVCAHPSPEGVMRSKRRCVLAKKQPYSGDEWCSGADTDDEDKPHTAAQRESRLHPSSLTIEWSTWSN